MALVLTFFAVWVLGESRAEAQSHSETQLRIFTVDEAVAFALKNYPAVRASLERVRAAEGGVGVARTSYLPRTDLLWQTNRATDNNITGLLIPNSVTAPITGPVTQSPSDQSAWGSAGGLLFSWEPLDFGYRGARVDAARWLLLVCGLVLPWTARSQGLSTSIVDEGLGRPGQKTGDVYKVGFPRTDLQVTVHGLAIKPGLALGSWAAFLGTDDHAMVMGDLVLLEDEVNPVVDKLRGSGFEITAIHNHLIDETPHVLYVHYMGHGAAGQVVASLKEALSVSKTPLGKPAPSAEESAPPAWVNAVQDSVGRKGNFKGGVLSYGVARSDQITMDGMTVPPAAGVAEAINFQAANASQVATTGDFVLTASEVNPVLSELRAHGIAITALHSHMLTEQPRLFFMHFWAVGDPQTVGAGIKAAMSHVAVK